MNEARTAPIAINNVLIVGLASMSPVRKIPPVIVNKDPRRIIKGR
jgi:hypothetical protein